MSGILSPRTLPHGLRAALLQTGLTVEELARQSGLAVSTMHNYLRTNGRDMRTPGGRELRSITLVLAESMGVSADDLWMEFGRLLDHTPSQR